MYLQAIKETNKYLETSLTRLLKAGEENQLANDQFGQFLLQMDPQEVDQKVQALNSEIAPKIDCTACGNCCKTLLININEKEADALSEHLDQTREIFDQKYLEKHYKYQLLHLIILPFLVFKYLQIQWQSKIVFQLLPALSI